MPVNEAFAATLSAKLESMQWQDRLAALCENKGLNIAFSTSLGFEDQALTHIIALGRLPIRIFTLDTGRLFEETYALHQKTRDTYGVVIDTYYPDAVSIQRYVMEQGINGFYNSVENRKACCHIRKVEPLARALKGVDVWVSGLRREHSDTRSHLGCTEWDVQHNLVKFYPLIDVGAEALWAFIGEHKIPTNPMHERGFPSIGCAPCTRAIQPGEPPRAGRWWWEQNSAQECGLHRGKAGAHA